MDKGVFLDVETEEEYDGYCYSTADAITIATLGSICGLKAVQELLRQLDVSGCMVAADAMHCRKETAKAVVDDKADYLLNVKDNQPALKADIEDYVQDRELQKGMQSASTREKNRERIEKRTAFVTNYVFWLVGADE